MADSDGFKESTIPAFALFPSFSQEIRDMIWDRTLLPRIISFNCNEYDSDPAKDTLNTYRLSTSAGTAAGPTLPLVLLPGPEIRFTVSKVDPIISLLVCRESRSRLLRRGGYRPWKIINTDGRVRDMMWSPVLDTIALIEAPNHRLAFLYRDVFNKQFPMQTKEIQSLALPTGHWTYGYEKSTNGGIVSRWLNFESLREIVIVIDEQYEVHCVATLETRQAGSEQSEPWVIPRDVEQGLRDLKSSLPTMNWSLPKVRVVRNYAGVLGVQSEGWRLRSRFNPAEQDLKQLY